MDDFGITHMLDLKRLGLDLQKASAGDRDARARVDYVRQNAPLVSSLTAPKPKSKIAALPAATDLTGGGLSAAMLPAPKDRSDLGMLSASLPAPHAVGAGGGGVEVPEQEKAPRNWGNILSAMSVGLTDIGNALGNERSPIQTGGYEMAKRNLQEQQLSQLKMRHDMWSDAYTQAQQLPSEVLSNPEFASLAQAKDALEKDMMDGKVDNEKNVSNFLTEQARYKGKLDQLIAASRGQQAAAAEEATATARGTRRAELEDAAAAGDAKAQATLALLGPSEQQKFDLAKSNMEADNRRLDQQAKWAHEDRLSALEDRAFARNQALQGRQDMLDDRAAGRRGSYLTSSYESAVARRSPSRKELEMMDPDAAQEAMALAQREALRDLMPRLEAAAQASGHRITYPDPGDVTSGFMVDGQRFNSPEEMAVYLLGQLGG